MMASADVSPATRDRGEGRDAFAAALMIIQGLILWLLALVSAVVPHSTRCQGAHGKITTCGTGIGGVPIAAALVGVVLIALAGALMSGARWARTVAFWADAVLAAASVAVLAITFGAASPADRSTYASLWVMAILATLLTCPPVALLWPRRHRPTDDRP